jgi:zinc protease
VLTEDVPVPPIHQITLPNGMRALLVEKRGLPIVTIRAAIDFGTDDGPLLAMAFFGTGTPTRPLDILGQGFREMGASRELSPLTTSTSYDVKVTSPNAAAALVRVADVLQNAICRRDDLSEAKRLAMSALSRQRSNSALRAAVELERSVDPGQKSLDQLTAAVQGTSLADADQSFHSHVTPERTLLLVAGELKTAELEAEVRKRFSGWKRTSASLAPPRVVPAPTASRVLLVDNPGASQADIAVGAWTPPNADEGLRASLIALDELLGGGMSGRLGDATREHFGVTYGAYSSILRHRTHSVFVVTGAFETERAALGLTHTLGSIESLSTKPFTVAEIKEGHARTAARSFATSHSTVSTLSPWIRTIDHEPLSQFLARTLQPTQRTPEELSRVAAEYLARPRLQIVVVGDAKRLKPDLIAAGLTPTETIPY